MTDEEGNVATQRAAATQQQNGGNFFNPFAIELPEKLDFRDPSDWKRWSARWERYRVVSGLHLRDAETQVNTFLYAMGKGAEDILASLQLTDADLADYTTVKGKFEEHFIPCTNIIFERAKFNRRKQEFERDRQGVHHGSPQARRHARIRPAEGRPHPRPVSCGTFGRGIKREATARSQAHATDRHKEST